MRLVVFLAAAAAAGLIACGLGAVATPAPSTSAAAATATQVKLDNYSFKPASITVPVGTTVVWKNLDDDPHTVTAVDKSFDSKGMGQGDTFAHRFAKPGTYKYYCAVHPFMKGTVIVEEAH